MKESRNDEKRKRHLHAICRWGLSGASGLIHIAKNNVVNDRNCGFVFAPKTFDTVVALSNFLVCVLGLCRFSFVLYHFSLFLFYSCPVFLLSCTFDLSFFLSVFFPPSIRVILSSRSHCQSNTRKVAINESIKW